MSPVFHLRPIDEDDPTAGYEAVVESSDHVFRNEFAKALIKEGLPTDVETVLALFDAEQAAIASLMRQGWDVATPDGFSMETPWPDPELAIQLGGTLRGRPKAGGEHLMEHMIELGVPHTRSQIKALFAAQKTVLVRMLRQGCEVEHPACSMYPTIEGIFNDPDDDFDPQQHEAGIECEEESDIVDWLKGYREMEQRRLSGPPRPLLDGYDNVNTGLSGGQIALGHSIRLRGYWLRYQDFDPRQGIFLTDEDGAARRIKGVLFTGLCVAFFTWPRDLSPGPYWLEVRALLVPRDGLQRGAWPEPIPVVAEG